MNKQMIRDSLVLFAITLIAGLLLGGVYELTRNPIAYAKKEKQDRAFQEVFMNAEFEPLGEDVFNEEITSKVLLDAGYEKQSIDAAYLAKDSSGKELGYVLVVTSNEAYGGSLQIAMGVQMNGTLNGISYLLLEETTGLGMEAKKTGFYMQFADKNVDRFVYTKSGATADDEIDALSGATITTNAVTNAVNAGLVYAQYLGVEHSEDINVSNDLSAETMAGSSEVKNGGVVR